MARSPGPTRSRPLPPLSLFSRACLVGGGPGRVRLVWGNRLVSNVFTYKLLLLRVRGMYVWRTYEQTSQKHIRLRTHKVCLGFWDSSTQPR